MPVDAAEALVGEEGPGAARELGMAEDLLEDRQQLGTAGLRGAAEVRVRRKTVEHRFHVPGVPDPGGEVQVAVHVADHEAAVTRLDQRLDDRAVARPIRREPVAAEESWQVPVRVEQIAVLVGAVQIAGTQSGQQRQGLLGTEQSAGQHRHLPLQHLRQATDPCDTVSEIEDVVGVVQRIRSRVGPHARVDVGLRGSHERLDLCGREDGAPAAEAGIDPLPVRLARSAHVVHEGPPGFVIEATLQIRAMVFAGLVTQRRAAHRVPRSRARPR